MNRSRAINAGIFLLIIGLALFGWWYAGQEEPYRILPVYGQRKGNSEQGDPNDKFHQIAPFQLIDQKGNAFTRDKLKGKLYVADFFFANCRDICPIMSGQMERVYEAFKSEPRLILVSHTVDPLRDTVEALDAYAQKHHAEYGRWYFLTGDKAQIYQLARQSYLLSASEGDGGAGDFVHTQHFALMDTLFRIRGIYDGTDSLEVDKLILDIRELLKESGFNKRK